MHNGRVPVGDVESICNVDEYIEITCIAGGIHALIEFRVSTGRGVLGAAVAVGDSPFMATVSQLYGAQRVLEEAADKASEVCVSLSLCGIVCVFSPPAFLRESFSVSVWLLAAARSSSFSRLVRMCCCVCFPAAVWRKMRPL